MRMPPQKFEKNLIKGLRLIRDQVLGKESGVKFAAELCFALRFPDQNARASKTVKAFHRRAGLTLNDSLQDLRQVLVFGQEHQYTT